VKPPFIVAELSANHLGSKERALQIIAAAAHAGADAVKFQAWTPGAMTTGWDDTIRLGPWSGRSLRELYKEAFTPWEWFPDMFNEARRNNMVPFASVFDDGALAFLEDMDCPVYKIASFELVDLELIHKVAAKKKPMVMSTGMADAYEIRRAVETAVGGGCTDLTLLQCTSAYPAPPEDARLLDLKTLRWTYPDVDVGLSDHTMGHTVAAVAAALGAQMIEKHLTMSRAEGGPDAGFSMEPHEFADMVKACKIAVQSMGTRNHAEAKSERPQLDLRRSLYYAKRMPAGTPIGEADMVARRPALGIHPHRRESLLNRVLTRDVMGGQPVSEEDFK